MTGGGFGGCTVTLVNKANVEDLIKNIQVCFIKNLTIKTKQSSLFAFIICVFSKSIAAIRHSTCVIHVKAPDSFHFRLITNSFIFIF